jgi:lambda family phage portal protein
MNIAQPFIRTAKVINRADAMKLALLNDLAGASIPLTTYAPRLIDLQPYKDEATYLVICESAVQVIPPTAVSLRRFFSGYEAAGISGRWPRASSMSVPLAQQIAAIAERAHFLAENSPYVRAIVSNMVTAFVGDGPSLQHPNAQIVKAWNEKFWSYYDAEGVSDLGHLIARAMRSVIVTGDGFIIERVNEFSGSLELLLIPTEQIDHTRNLDLGDGWFITAGVETNAEGRHVAIWGLPRPPDSPVMGATSIEAKRIPIDDVIHVFDPPSPGAVHGISWLVASLTRALEVDSCEDAQLAQQKVAALLCVMVNDPSNSVNIGEEADCANKRSLEPGTIIMNNGDATATVVNPPQNDNGTEFARHMVRSLAAACQVPYELVSADLSQTSFSSARFGDRFFRRRCTQVQKTILEPQFLNRVFKRFCALEVLSGRLNNIDLESLAAPKWLWPGFDPIDPLKDTSADVESVAAGLASRAEIIAKCGRDIRDVDQEIAADPRPAPIPKPQAQDSANIGETANAQ